MAFETITTNQTATYTVDSLDTVILAPRTYIIAEFEGISGLFPLVNSFYQFFSTDLRIFGEVIAGTTGINYWDPASGTGTFDNHSIHIAETGIVSGGDYGIRAASGDNNSIVNFGTISGNTGIWSDGWYSSNIDNHGSIIAETGLAIHVSGYVASNMSIVNTGIISSQSGTAISFNYNAASCFIDNSGLIVGDIWFGDDADTYTATGDGLVQGIIRGNGGNDTITGGAQGDMIHGGDHNDRLIGRDGNDLINGDSGHDYVFAGADEDTVNGGDGKDRLYGGGGDDIIDGGKDNDVIRAGSGDDMITGGRGADILRGGSGADVFIYTAKQESTLNLSDKIKDYEAGTDQIDLSAVTAGLSFVGTAAFSSTGSEVRLATSGNSTFVEVDTNGDGSADMRIILGQVGTLTEDDFVL